MRIHDDKKNSGRDNAGTAWARDIASKLGKELHIINSPVKTNLDKLCVYMQSHGVPAVMLSMDRLPKAADIFQKTGVLPFVKDLRPDLASSGPNMNRVTPSDITNARQLHRYQGLKHPIININYVGVNYQGNDFDNDPLIAELLGCLPKEGGTLLISSSVRVVDDSFREFVNKLNTALANQSPTHKNPYHIIDYSFKHLDPDNPYTDMLAAADAHVLLGYSRTTAGDLSLTGKPVYSDMAVEVEVLNAGAAKIGDASKRFQAISEHTQIDCTMSFPPFDTTGYYGDKFVAEYKTAIRQNPHIPNQNLRS